MSDIENLPAFSVCPLRSPVVVEREDPAVPFFDSKAPPKQVLGPCLREGCGMYMVTQADQSGKVLAGMCSMRFFGMALDGIVGNLIKLTGAGGNHPGGNSKSNPFNIVPK